MLEDLIIVEFPDPRLRRVAVAVTQFDEALQLLVERMFELMREHQGVGLAAPQVGQSLRLFIANATGQPADDRVYINPEFLDVQGDEQDEEGCLSLPKIRAKIWRGDTVTLRAQDVTGKSFEQTEPGFVARIWQHEMDHLNGTLILDRMGPTDKLATRKLVKDLEDKFAGRKPRK